MPIHVRAEPGEYAEAVLLPGDPLRAAYIAETYFDDPCSGTPSAACSATPAPGRASRSRFRAPGWAAPERRSSSRSSIQLGCKKLIRVGTCGGLQPNHALGDLIVALTAVPADSTAMHLVGNEPHCPTASWSLVHEAVHLAKHSETELHVGPIVSSDLFYNPDGGQYERWSSRGVLAVEMEAAALFTVAALKRIESACLLTVSDIVVEGEFKRISDEELKAAVDRMTKLALDVATAELDLCSFLLSEPRAIFLVNPASANGATAKRWPKLRARAAELGLPGDELLSEGPGHLTDLARGVAVKGACVVVVGGDGTLNEVANGIAGTGAEVAVLPNGTGQDFGRTHGIPSRFDDAVGWRSGQARESTWAAPSSAGRTERRRAGSSPTSARWG